MELIAVGLFFTNYGNKESSFIVSFTGAGIFFALFNTVFFLFLIAALMPQRQTLLDWAQERRKQVSSNDSKGKIWAELLIGEKSPAVLTFFVNLLIAGSIAGLGTLIRLGFETNSGVDCLRLFVGVVLSIGIYMVYAATAQSLLLLRTNKRLVWALAGVSTLFGLPIALACALSIGMSGSGTPLMLLSGLPWISLFGYYHLGLLVIGTLFVQAAAFAGVTANFQKRFKKAGESQLKKLMSDEPLRLSI
jgi:hypothetical protein